jgi:hypothetical protein
LYRKLERYQRDGLWYPKRYTTNDEDNDEYSYDTDGNLKEGESGKEAAAKNKKGPLHKNEESEFINIIMTTSLGSRTIAHLRMASHQM